MINTVDVVADLLQELGPDLDVLGILQHEEERWAIIYDEQTMVDIHWHQGRKCLALSVELGDVPVEKQAATYRYLLAYSALVEQTGGIRIALESPDGGLVQMLDLFTEELDRVTLESVLTNFVDKARAWRQVLAQGIADHDISQDLLRADSEFDGLLGMRV